MTPRVPAEFLGQARRLRQRIAEADATASLAIDAATSALRARWRRHPVPLRDDVANAECSWRRTIPELGRLDLATDRRRKRLRIVEVRASASAFRSREWETTEPGIAALSLTLEVAPWRFGYTQTPLALVSLHALARRFERGWRVTEETVLAELLALARVAGDVGAEFCAPAAEGRWVGTIAEVVEGDRRSVVASVRTFKVGA